MIAALGAGTLLLRPLLAKALRDRIDKKRADVEEASRGAAPTESSPLKVFSYSDADAILISKLSIYSLAPSCRDGGIWLLQL